MKTVQLLLKNGFGITEKSKDRFFQVHPKQMIGLALSDFCSHKCWYCCNGKPYNGKKTGIIDSLGVEKYSKCILKMSNENIVEYRIYGNEPTEHPNFKDLVKVILDNGHFLTILTNGTNSDVIESSFSGFSKEYISRVKMEMSFHLGVYAKDSSDIRLKKYFNVHFPKALLYCKSIVLIIPLSPNILVFDSFIKNVNILIEMANSANVDMQIIPTEFYGSFFKKQYPKDYSDGEKKVIQNIMEKYNYEKVFSKFDKNSVSDLCKMNKGLYLKGMPCYFVNNFLRISSSGDVSCCGSGIPNKIIGEITDNILLPKKYEPFPCPYDVCVCPLHGTRGCLDPNEVSYSDYFLELNKL